MCRIHLQKAYLDKEFRRHPREWIYGLGKVSMALDRFIPNRSAMDFDYAHYMLSGGKVKKEHVGVNSSSYLKLLAQELNMNRTRILTFKNKPPPSFERVSESPSHIQQSKIVKKRRYFPQSAERILDAPDILEDFYHNLLDWGSNNVIAIRTLRGHRLRVGSLDWNGGHILTTGSTDRMIFNNDVRVRSYAVGTYRGHTQEICGLKWSESGQQLASGGNDNLVHIQSLSMRSPNNSRQWIHRGSVGDQCIKFWNINAGACLNTVDTGSQSPDGYTVATAAADETLRLWNDFRNPEENQPVLKRKLDPFFDLVFHVITIIIKGEATNAKETTWKYSKLLFYEFKLPKQSLAEMHEALTSMANERPFSASTTTLLLYLMVKWRSCCWKLDRFIPNYSVMDFDYAHYMLSGGKVKKEHVGVNSSSKEAYLKLFVTPRNRVLGRHTVLKATSRNAQEITNEAGTEHLNLHYGKIRHTDKFCGLTGSRDTVPSQLLTGLLIQTCPYASPKILKLTRDSAERTLEALDIPDDFYLNLLDWGRSNVIAIGLGNSVYLWDASDGSTTELLTVGDDFRPVTSVNWSPDGRHLAVALNNSHVQLWDTLQGSNQLSNMVASGCGVGDQCIKFWNTNSGECMNTVDTGSQVCSLIWNRHECELLSSYSFTDNQLTVWKYPFMTKISKLFGHTSRVLHMAQSSDGYTVATAAADETLRLWNIFGNPEENKPMLKRKLEPFFDLVQLR
ncbi:hypothetical protein BC332_20531 [Capsicum chinense]|nr:hypothetical protein BC332_20531 [Capsicum chinense]